MNTIGYARVSAPRIEAASTALDCCPEVHDVAASAAAPALRHGANYRAGGIRLRRKTASWDDEYLASLVAA
jgi:hypothetical protein